MQSAQEIVAAQPYWYHKFEIAPGVVTPGVYDVSYALEDMNLPSDMAGKTVLEIGPADGAFTKAMWERGADVTAVDYEDTHSFQIMRQLSGCTAKHLVCNALNIDTLQLGTFDYVVMMGVLYHLPDPLRGLWLMRQHMRPDSTFILETLISNHPRLPLMEYLPGSTNNNDETNFWAPSVQCCKDMMRDCGLVVERELVGDTRAMFHARVDPDPRSARKAARAYSGDRSGQAPVPTKQPAQPGDVKAPPTPVNNRASLYREAWVQRALDAAEATLAEDRIDDLCEALKPLPIELFALLYFDRPERWPKLAAWLPKLPSHDDQTLWTGSSGWKTMHNAALFVGDVFAKLGRHDPHIRVLDYGCGWGRMIRLLYQRVRVGNIYGADPWARSLETLQAYRVHGHLAQVAAIPASPPYPGVAFDLIYAYSVFTHIGPRSQAAVLKALRQAIKPGGLLALTIRQANYWADLPADKWPGPEAQARLFEEHVKEGFAHIAGAEREGGHTEFGSTSISLDYIAENWRDWKIDGADWRTADPYQTTVFLRPA